MVAAPSVAELVAVLGIAGCLPSATDDGGSSTTAALACGRWHPDEDGDGFGAADVAIETCNPPPGWLMDDRDCYDGNADARPDQIAYFAVHRGDGGFDYDCDGFATVALRELGGCHGEPACPVDVGWRTGLAQCGSLEDWVTDCDGPVGDAPMCTWTIEQRRQQSR